MCGISGIVSAQPLTPAHKVAVRKMADHMVHRGPDDCGYFESETVALAMRRLSIIDIAGSSQPLTSDDGTVTMVFNGEIYNFAELRASLSQSGYSFRTQGDGEAIIALYRRHGLDFVDHLRGMFAIALWDAPNQRLILARDRMGEKPLYYRQDGQSLVFASEMKALLASGLVPFELDSEAVHLYFHFQYVPEPMTAVSNVRKLDAGSLLVIDTAPWRVSAHSYWRLDEAPVLDGDPAILIRERMEEASRLCLASDVPIGVALSGGIDSSAVAMLASQSAKAPTTAISVGYVGAPPNDERAMARSLSARLGLAFEEVEIDDGDMVEAFPALTRWSDDPVADIAGYGYYALMQRAAERGLKVMLQGHGGDELFWGYPELRAARSRMNRPPWLPPWSRRRRSPYEQMPDFRGARAGIGDYYAPDFAASVADVDPVTPFVVAKKGANIDIALTDRVCAGYLRSNGIAQSERLGMASSVELRLPFMDHQLVETVVGLRKHRSDAGLAPKAWLKAAVADLLPPEILTRPKRGFAPPVRRWHEAIFARHGQAIVGGYLHSVGVLSDKGAEVAATGVFPHTAISPLSFKILVLEQWCRQMDQIARHAAEEK